MVPSTGDFVVGETVRLVFRFVELRVHNLRAVIIFGQQNREQTIHQSRFPKAAISVLRRFLFSPVTLQEGLSPKRKEDNFIPRLAKSDSAKHRASVRIEFKFRDKSQRGDVYLRP